jgi:hypothetical protein
MTSTVVLWCIMSVWLADACLQDRENKYANLDCKCWFILLTSLTNSDRIVGRPAGLMCTVLRNSILIRRRLRHISFDPGDDSLTVVF